MGPQKPDDIEVLINELYRVNHKMASEVCIRYLRKLCKGKSTCKFKHYELLEIEEAINRGRDLISATKEHERSGCSIDNPTPDIIDPNNRIKTIKADVNPSSITSQQVLTCECNSHNPDSTAPNESTRQIVPDNFRIISIEEIEDSTIDKIRLISKRQKD